MQREPVHGSGNAVLAHAVMDVISREVAWLDDRGQLGERAVRAGEIGRASDQGGTPRHQLLQHLLRGLAGGELCRVTAKVGLERVYRGSDFGANLAVDRIDQVLACRWVQALRCVVPKVVGPGVTGSCRAPASKDRL